MYLVRDGHNIHSLAVLQGLLEKLRADAKVESLTELTKDMHVYPDFHGRNI
jgi:hypothetical protein